MRQLIALSVATLALLGAQDLRSQTQGTTPDARLDEPSGWLRFEVAVFVDSSEAALNSETWPIAPRLNYDDNRRWLTEFEETAGLLDEYPTAELVVHPNGSVTVVEPEPVVISDLEVQSLLEDSAIDATESVAVEMDDVAAIRDEFEPEQAGTQSRPLTSLSLLQEALEANDLLSPSNTTYPERVSQETASSDIDRPATGNAIPMEQLLSDPQADGSVAMADLISDEAGDATSSASDDIASDDGLTTAMDDDSPTESDENPIALGQTDAELFEASNPANEDQMPDDIFDLPGFGIGNGLEDDMQSPPIDWLNTLSEVTDQPNSVDVSSDSTLVEAPPALPTAFEKLPLEMLIQGLESLEKSSSKTPAFSAAWVQPNDAETQALIVDSWLGTSAWPELQGTLRIDIRDTPELSTNLWLNTNGAYMPDNFNASAPPVPDTRLTIIESPVQASEPTPPDEAVYVDMSTGLSVQADALPADEPIVSFDNRPVDWGWRHSITLKESRPLREGYVRYIDHPALQVIGVWREVTWRELYEMGEREKLKREIDTLTRALTATPESNTAPDIDTTLGSDEPSTTL